MTEFVFERTFEIEPPGGLNIYRLRIPSVDEQAVRQLAVSLGMQGSVEAGTFIQTARSISYSERSAWGVRLFRSSGGWQYRDATRWQMDDGQGNLTLNDDEAAQLALSGITDRAVAPAEFLVLNRVQRLHAAHAQRDGADHSERIIGARIVYRRVVDGLATEGPGGKTVVYIDHQRQLTGIDHLWHEIERVEEPVAELRTVDEVLEEVRRRYGDGAGRVEMSDLRLGYFELGWDRVQEYLQPAYVAFLRLVSPDPRYRVLTTLAIPAAVNSPGPVEPPSRQPEPQPARSR